MKASCEASLTVGRSTVEIIIISKETLSTGQRVKCAEQDFALKGDVNCY